MSISEALVIAGVGIILAVALFSAISNEIHTRAEWDMERHRKDLKRHQDWLFAQLCNQTPGKIKLPGAIDEELTSEPAKIYIPGDDPLNKISGQHSDWHG